MSHVLPSMNATTSSPPRLAVQIVLEELKLPAVGPGVGIDVAEVRGWEDVAVVASAGGLLPPLLLLLVLALLGGAATVLGGGRRG